MPEDDIDIRLLDQRVTNIEDTISRSLVTLSTSVEKSFGGLSRQVEDLKVLIVTNYVLKTELEVHAAKDQLWKKEMEGMVKAVLVALSPIQKIVYGAVALALTAIVTGLIAMVMNTSP